jgi:hypothetical protein
LLEPLESSQMDLKRMMYDPSYELADF